MVQFTPFIVHVAALLLSTLSCCSGENVYCVTPTQPTDTSCSLCPHNLIHCATLSEYAQQAKSYFTSNTTMVFLPGDHTLDMNITVANISRMTMCGETSSGYVATVVCSGSVGLSFTSMVDFKIHSLTFTTCGRNFDIFNKSALLLESIEYAVLVNCSFHDNLGTALTVCHTNITLAENNEFTHNHCGHEGFLANCCIGGGGITALYSNLTFIGNTTFRQNHTNFSSAGIYMFNCSLSSNGSIHFINNSLTPPDFSKSSGIAIWASASSMNITGATNFISNSNSSGMSNRQLSFCHVVYASHNTSLSITGNSNFINNSVGAIFANDNTSVNFIGTSNFINNSAFGFGGAIYAWQNTSLSFNGTSNFINNSADYGGAIYALGNTSLIFTGTNNFINNRLADYGNGGAIFAASTSLSFNGTSNFTNNSAAQNGGAIYASVNTSLCFTGTSNFINNLADYGSGGAIYASDKSLSFTGTNNFINNTATGLGGGVYVWNSTFSVLSNTTVYWENNHAQLGGAIFVDDGYKPLVYCTVYTTKDKCFFQLPGQNLSNGIDAKFVFKDNSAVAGSVLYGGAIDYCKLTGLESYSSGEVFDMLVHIENYNTNSSISSEPFHICPCENNHPDCSISYKLYRVYPGETFHVSVVAVGQRNGIVPTTARGDLTYLYSHTSIGDVGKLNLHPLQYLQETSNVCTILNYTVFSLLEAVGLQLLADGPCSTFSNELNLILFVRQTCPPGFNLSAIERSCVCNQRLAKYTNCCDITNGLGRITRNSIDHFWVGWVQHCIYCTNSPPILPL